MSVLNKSGDHGKPPKLSEVLFPRPRRSFNTLAPLPSNVQAIESGLRFAAHLETHVLVLGPSGWGKSHLLEATCLKLSENSNSAYDVLTAIELASNPQKGESVEPLVIDDVQEVLGRPRPEMALRLNLERRVRAGRPTMLAFTMAKPCRQLKAFVPCFRNWNVCTLAEPQAAERIPLINQMSEAEGLSLSPALVKVIANGMYGNGRTLSGALKRLRLSGTTWLDSSSTLKACGLLEPFFADSPVWDLKHKILKVADANKALFPKATVTDLAVVTMLQEAGLAEGEVARCLGISPADAYQRAGRFKEQAKTDSATRGYVPQLVELVVESLQ